VWGVYGGINDISSSAGFALGVNDFFFEILKH
jgi:hypothetical protein